MRNSANAGVLQGGSSAVTRQNSLMRNRNGSRGVTLIELSFGLAVVAVLAGLAAPGFRGALRASAVRSASFELLAGLQEARGSAILEARPGVLCLSDAAGNCLVADAPATAWRSYLETEGGAVPLSLRVLPGGVTLHATRSPLRFWPNAISASTSTLTICDTAGIARPRAIVLSQSGRVRLGEAADAACSS
jgi:prepilin-type N-terminal cleavage/methylation domain-containing protein